MQKTRTQTEIEMPSRYCLYARKSSEEDERQALSINSQIKEMLDMAKRDGLRIVETRQESHSAKQSNGRPVFNQLLSEVKTGRFNAILTWAPDRLSRNAGDLGSIVDLMDQGLLSEIRTYGQKFTNSPNDKFMLMILCSQAKLENDNKGVNVKRGLRAKCEMGIRPGSAPLGYLNEMSNIRGQSRILIDPDRAPIIKEMFNKAANEFWTGREIYNWLRDDLNFRNRTGKHLALSGIYRILESEIYYGEFEFPKGSGKWYKSSAEPLIDKKTFERARGNLEVAPRQFGLKEFQFTKLITCGKCGSSITATEKFKRNLECGMKRYVYYHCAKGKDYKCDQAYIREEELLLEFIRLMDKIDFNKEKLVNKLKNEVEKYNKFSSVIAAGKRINKNKIIPGKINIRDYAKFILKEGTIQEKRDLLLNLKSKLVLTNKKIIIKN